MHLTRTLWIGLAGLLTVAVAGAAERTQQWEKRHYTMEQGTLPCIGAYTLEVWSQLRINAVTDSQGGLHVQVHFNTSNMKVTDEAGREYVGGFQINNSFYLPPLAGTARSHTQVSQIRLVGRADAPNLRITTRLIVAANADGVVTAEHVIDRVECSAE